LGIVPPIDESPFPETAINLKDGILYIFTDGVTEGYTQNGNPLEIEGLKTLLNENKNSSMQSRLKSVVSHLQDVPTPLRDDITILAIEGRKTA
jgi:sigma-B regulation protein RsbU (phosphoserine phosphatase)